MPDLPDIKYVRVGETSLAYARWGTGDACVVFTPPLVSNIELMWELPEWERLFDWAGQHFRVLVMDKRGVGLSDRTSEPATLSDYVQDVIAVLDAEGLGAVHIAGQSEGGVVGLALAAQHPERVKKLGIIGTPALGVSRATLQDHLEPGEHLPAVAEVEDLWRDLVRTWGTKDSIWLDWFAPTVATDQRLRRWWSKFERQSCSPGGLLSMIRGMNGFDLLPVLPAVSAPTLVCHTKGDRVAHIAEGRVLARMIPNAAFKTWDTPNHLWGFDAAWRDHANDLIEFFTGHRPGRASSTAFAAVLFTDIVGSTQMASTMGNSAWHARLARHDATCQTHVRARRGTLVKQTGDGMLATFASPLEAVQAAQDLAWDLDSLGLPIRAGVHIGQIERHDNADISGLTVNVAARVQALAGPGDVLVSQTVRDMLLGTGFEMTDRGVHALKGVDGTWQVFAVTPQV